VFFPELDPVLEIDPGNSSCSKTTCGRKGGRERMKEKRAEETGIPI
jgi:hypothetical protein